MSTTSFRNQWALIIGGSSGLGLATAKKLAEHGMNICIVHRDRKRNLAKFEAAVEIIKTNGVEVKTINKDALSPEVRQEVLSMLPKSSVKVIVHSVAKGSLKPMTGESTLTKSDLDITIHAMGTNWYEWTQDLIKANKFVSDARTIAFTSEGNTRAWPGYGAVSAAKATLEALMRQMAVEFAPLQLTSNCIQAGASRTPSFEMIPGSDALAEIAKKRNPFGRLTQPEDVANAVYLLCTDEANWINGCVLKVDGGESLR